MAVPNDQRRPRYGDDRPNVREYAIALALITLSAIVAFIVFGQETETILSTVSHSV
jgi:hypothetical protein